MARGLVLALLLAVLAGPMGLLRSTSAATEPAGLPQLVRTKHRSFSIPFRLPKSQDPDAEATAQRVLLQVSKDMGATWEPAGEASPASSSFTYRADVDGEYWFRLRAVDGKGRTRGGEGADMRVLVDAAGPRLVGRVWKGADGEIVCRYAAVDDSISIESLKLEYRGPADAAWKTVATEGILARQSPAHMVGEEIWWAGEKVDALTVRITVSDSSANQTVRQFTMEPTDPRVDQAALAAELGVPALPGQGEELPSTDRAAISSHPGSEAIAATPGGSDWKAEPSSWSQAERGSATDRGDGGRSVLVKRTSPTAAAGGAGSKSDSIATSTAVPAASRQAGSNPPATRASSSPGIAGGQPLEYQGKPLHLSRSRRFSWDYELPAPTADGGRLHAELWCTRDGGVTWQQAAVDADGRSPIDVQLPAAGLYGFRLEVVAEAGTGGPRSGDAPETWVGIDEEPPQVELLEVTRGEGDESELLIRYAARDPLLAPQGGRILYSPHAEGPWATIASGVGAEGVYRWKPDRGVPARAYVRVEVADVAGNIGAATSSDPVPTAVARFIGKLGGLRPLPAPAAAQ